MQVFSAPCAKSEVYLYIFIISINFISIGTHERAPCKRVQTEYPPPCSESSISGTLLSRTQNWAVYSLLRRVFSRFPPSATGIRNEAEAQQSLQPIASQLQDPPSVKERFRLTSSALPAPKWRRVFARLLGTDAKRSPSAQPG